MSNHLARKRGIRLLIFFGIFCYFCINWAKGVEVKKDFLIEENTFTESAQVCTSCAEQNEERMVIGENEYIVNRLSDDEVVDVTNQVLGSSSGSCEPYQNSFNVRRLCTEGSKSGQLDDGADNGSSHNASKSGGEVELPDNMNIELVKITFPAQFASGKKAVKDNRKDISYEDPVYVSFGDSVSVNYTNSFKTPNQVEEEEKTSGLSGDGKNTYMIFAENAITSAVQDLGKRIGEYIVEKTANKKYESLCEEPIQPSYFNPKPTNDNSVQLDSLMQVPGGDPVVTEDKECLSKNNMTETMSNPIYLEDLCSDESTWASFEGLIKSFFSQQTWNDCKISKLIELPNGDSKKEDDVCVSVENIVIEMSSLFGSVEECEGEVCANSFLTRRFRSKVTPTEVGDYKLVGNSSEDSLTHTILTPCTIKITMDGQWFKPSSPNLEVYCMWDTTPTIMNYRAHQIEKIPAEETFPKTFEDYFELVKQVLVKDGELSKGGQ
jgi:hypothetical protein